MYFVLRIILSTLPPPQWRVNGVLRIGFFAIKTIKKGTELCFDYQYQRFGDDVQTCYCGTDKCRGTLGEKLSDLARPSPKRSDEKGTDKKIEVKKKDSESVSWRNKPRFIVHVSVIMLESLCSVHSDYP